MKKFMKRGLIASILLIVLLVSNRMVTTAAQNKENTLPFRELTGEELTNEMGAGWNLGNTMDGHSGFTPGETVWQPTITTKAMIKSVHDLGFNTVRIPVTWGTMIDDDNNYAIDEAWISRVQDIVDYCISQDMYVIINIHHDGAEQSGWLRIATDDKEALYEKFGGVWENIAERFKDYDEHLMFEAMNEVKGDRMTVAQETKVIMDLNQIFVDKIRATGSNNAKRWLVITGKYNFIDSVTNKTYGFAFPKDTVEENRFVVSVHDYTPWAFCGQETQNMTTYTLKNLQINNRKELKQMYDTYSSKGIPVIVGEYGAINKDNVTDRAYYLEAMNRMFRNYKLVGVYWDQGWFDRSQKPDYSFAIINRETGKPIEKTVTDAMIRGFFTNGDENCEDITKDTKVMKITKIKTDQTNLFMTIGDSAKITTTVEPQDTNDVVLWKTADPTVATVAYGNVRARGIGSTTITAYSQSGSVKKKLYITVTAAEVTNPCTDIVTDKEEYELTEKEYVYLGATAVPENDDVYFTYRSSNEKVATVSTVGKLLAIGEGETVITITASSGFAKQIKVKVEPAKVKNEISLAINVLYNDTAKGFFGNEISSQVLTIDKNGKYTLTFDCDTDLSKAAQDKGIASLNNLTAIYIKDYNVTTGKINVSPLKKCTIKYNKIVVDGKTLKITNTKKKSALKDSGIFDSNDPINSWDGSVVNGVTSSNHVCNFSGLKKPTKISITFTISGMVFADGSKAENK